MPKKAVLALWAVIAERQGSTLSRKKDGALSAAWDDIQWPGGIACHPTAGDAPAALVGWELGCARTLDGRCRQTMHDPDPAWGRWNAPRAREEH